MENIDKNYYFRMHTDNAYANYLIEQRLSLVPEFWALIKYLERKGLLDREEFWETLNEVCAEDLETVNSIVRQQNQEEAK